MRFGRFVSRTVVTIGALTGLVILMGSLGPDTRVLAYLLLPMTLFFAVFVHEMGHATMGSAVGMKLQVFAAYPFELSVAPLRLRWIRRRDRRELGGFVQFEAMPQPLHRWVAMIAAGPVANLLLAAVAGATMTRAAWPSLMAGEGAALAGVSGSMATANLVPQGTSDGATLLAAVREYRTNSRAGCG